MPTMLLAHPRGPLVDMMFSGHTHGGQVTLPLIGPLHPPSGGGRNMLKVSFASTTCSSTSTAASGPWDYPSASTARRRSLCSLCSAPSRLRAQVSCTPACAIQTHEPSPPQAVCALLIDLPIRDGLPFLSLLAGCPGDSNARCHARPRLPGDTTRPGPSRSSPSTPATTSSCRLSQPAARLERLQSLGVPAADIPAYEAPIYTGVPESDRGPGGHILTGPVAIAEAGTRRRP